MLLWLNEVKKRCKSDGFNKNSDQKLGFEYWSKINTYVVVFEANDFNGGFITDKREYLWVILYPRLTYIIH